MPPTLQLRRNLIPALGYAAALARYAEAWIMDSILTQYILNYS